jgi:hypothetical protein
MNGYASSLVTDAVLEIMRSINLEEITSNQVQCHGEMTCLVYIYIYIIRAIPASIFSLSKNKRSKKFKNFT